MGSWLRRKAGEVEYWQCMAMWETCGLQTAFTTRRAGASQGPFESLNFGGRVGDEPALVDQNRQAFFKALHIDPAQVRLSEQVHGAAVRPAGDRGYPAVEPGVDGLIDLTGQRVLLTFHADCAPVYLGLPGLPVHALVHAGWRGTAAGIAARAVEQLTALTGRPASSIHAAIGPCIHSCCYEVGDDVVGPMKQALGARFLEAVEQGGAGARPRLNLAAANRIVLEEAGIPGEHIYESGLCTACLAGDFFSHRRDAGRTGRMLAWQRKG